MIVIKTIETKRGVVKIGATKFGALWFPEVIAAYVDISDWGVGSNSKQRALRDAEEIAREWGDDRDTID